LKLSCDLRPEHDRPAAHSLVADADAALSRKFPDIAKTECEAEVEPERVGDNFGRKPFAACRKSWPFMSASPPEMAVSETSLDQPDTLRSSRSTRMAW
jgi:hypothetical protein